MSPQWMWKSAGECRGPVDSIELQELLRSGRIRDADEVQAAGTTEWTAARELRAVFAGDNHDSQAADTAAMLLIAAGQLRLGGAFDGTADPPKRATPGERRSLWTTLSARRALLAVVLLGLSALQLPRHLGSTPSNASAFARLSRLAESLVPVHKQTVPGSDDAQTRQFVALTAQQLADQLEAATERLPLLTLSQSDADPDSVLARRELLFAARDLERLARTAHRSPVLEAEYQRHMQLAAAYLTRQQSLTSDF